MKEVIFQILCVCWIYFASVQAAHRNDCNGFFSNNSYAIPHAFRNRPGLVKLCQNMWPDSPAYFATLFDTGSKIPVYSASKANMVGSYSRNAPSRVARIALWKRVSYPLCNANPGAGPMLSKIKSIQPRQERNCKRKQAIFTDYGGSQVFSKGHLEPRMMNNNNDVRQRTTFTLTNAAPQYTLFNNGSWEKVERIVKRMIQFHASGQDVYIVTGVWGTAKNGNGDPIRLNRLKVPKFFWKGVCFPGSNTQTGWSFAVKIENKNEHGPMSKTKLKRSFVKLKTVMDDVFGANKSPFTTRCLNFGIIGVKRELERHWQYYTALNN